MTLRDIARLRLVKQQIASTTCRTPADVVAALGAVQAQDFAGALWAVGLRFPGGTESGILQALAEGKIVRTWPMRGTLHFVAAEDVRWMLPLLTPRIIAGGATRHRQLELDDVIFARSRKIFGKALQGGGQLTRDEMYALLEGAGISTTGQRGYHILWRLAQEGQLCFGPHSSKQATFVLLDEWVPGGRKLNHEEALAELTLRYFRGHGPATERDFAWWAGLKISDARLGLELVVRQLVSIRVGEEQYWMKEDSLSPGKKAAGTYLLPGFDEYILGYTDRGAAVEPEFADRIAPGSNGLFLPTIVKDGRVVGLWKRVIKKKAALVTALPFSPLNGTTQKAFESTAKRYGQYLGLSAEVHFEE